MKKVFAACALALSAFCVSAQADTLKVGSHPTFAPFEFVDSEGKAIGFDIDLINAIAKANGDTVEIVSMPFDGLIPALVTNQIDAIISGMTITDARKERVEFTDGYYKSIQSVLIRKADAEKFKKVEDLKGQKICTQIGTTGDKFARTLSEDVIAMNNEPDALMELRNGGCAALINDRPTNLYYLLQSKATEIGELKDDSLYLNPEFYGIAVNKNNKALVKRLNAGLEKIAASGELKSIHEKWFGVADQLKVFKVKRSSLWALFFAQN